MANYSNIVTGYDVDRYPEPTYQDLPYRTKRTDRDGRIHKGENFNETFQVRYLLDELSRIVNNEWDVDNARDVWTHEDTKLLLAKESEFVLCSNRQSTDDTLREVMLGKHWQIGGRAGASHERGGGRGRPRGSSFGGSRGSRGGRSGHSGHGQEDVYGGDQGRGDIQLPDPNDPEAKMHLKFRDTDIQGWSALAEDLIRMCRARRVWVHDRSLNPDYEHPHFIWDDEGNSSIRYID